MSQGSESSQLEEPLLGRPGDATQHDAPLYYNLILGTGIIAQISALLIVAYTWGAIFTHDVILFSAHPLVNTTSVLLLLNGVLLLQPTHTAEQKLSGTNFHAVFMAMSTLLALGGLGVIEYNKFSHGGTHFDSPHAVLGFITYLFLVIQVLFGVLQFYAPWVLGGVERGKAVYKYHRLGGYVTLALMVVTVCAASGTAYGFKVLGLRAWVYLLLGVGVLVGTGARVKVRKFGWLAGY
ncbi:hypothetical protein K470DRAFT_300615 [Piedraia hortae CBS 480.64]|uniref:Cytochrome b561 domain-containing protein n=1 Tax=Piedraia hortae CBS 480.64 TaxID=1314780 RepID=A0A6A7BVP5_9PEZI|nr:hypothetical protein K470DRAFT_300615 [Piedraia hortae CBS 480.64]